MIDERSKIKIQNPIVQKQLYGGCPTEYIDVMKKIDEVDEREGTKR